MSVSAIRRRRRGGRKETFYLDWSKFTVGERPSDFRKVRTLAGYDLIVRADGAYTSGYKLVNEGSGNGSRVTGWEGSYNASSVEVVTEVKAGLTPAPATQDAVGGAVLCATMNEDGTNNEYGGRIFYNGANWEGQCWRYAGGAIIGEGAPNLQTKFGYVSGMAVRIRLRYDPIDKTAGPNGTVSWRFWKATDPEPGAWDAQQEINAANAQKFTDVVGGHSGLYSNNTAYRPEHAFLGVAINGKTAPTSGPGVTPTAVPPVSTEGYTVVDFSSLPLSALTLGAIPSGWTEEYQTAHASYGIEAVTGSTDGKALHITNGGFRTMLFLNALGQALTDYEVLARLRFRALSSFTGGLSLRIATNHNSAMCCNLDGSGNIQMTRFIADAFGQTSAAAMGSTNPAVNEWIMMRLRAKGTRFKAKYWRENTLEPVDFYLMDVQASGSVASGGVGIYDYEGNIDFDWLAFRPV